MELAVTRLTEKVDGMELAVTRLAEKVDGMGRRLDFHATGLHSVQAKVSATLFTYCVQRR